MATIKISDLQPAGFDLLLDSESYLQDLGSDDLMDNVVGGTSVSDERLIWRQYIEEGENSLRL